MAKKVCPRLRDSACWRSVEITQPSINFFAQLCTSVNVLEDFSCDKNSVKDRRAHVTSFLGLLVGPLQRPPDLHAVDDHVEEGEEVVLEALLPVAALEAIV